MPETLIDAELLRRLEHLTLVSRRLASSSRRGERKGRRRGMSADFADYRQYVYGDDLRHLDWKIYARLERMFLKLFLEEEELRVYLLVDSSASMGHGQPSKLHFAKQVAAALGHIALCRGDSLSTWAFSADGIANFGPRRGRYPSGFYLDFLSKQQAAGGTALRPSLHRFAAGTRGKALVVVLSDFFDDAGYEEALRLLFGRSFEVLVLQVLTPDELAPALQGDVRLVDCETAGHTDVSLSPALLKQYQRTLGAFTNGLRNYVTQRGGNYLLTSTDLPFDRLILEILRQRGVLK